MNSLKLLLLSLLLVLSMSSLTCEICQKSVKVSAQTLSFLIPDSIAVQGLEALCMRRYDSEKLCKKVGQEIAPLAISNFIRNRVNPAKKCSSICNGSFVHYNSEKQVERILTGESLKQINLQAYIHVDKFEIENKKNLRLLHISDIHQDKNYVEKASINCQYPICCHEQNGFPQNPSVQAKPFGSKSCDSPKKLLDSFLDFMAKQPQIDIIIGTGDFSAHNEWEKTDQSIIETQNQIQQKIVNKFPNSIFIKAEGNNDYVPDHQYDASKSPKLIKQTDITVGQAKLTFVALNTIAFDDFNLYLLGDQSYAIFQLMLLEQILQSNQNVYILGHIPPTLTGTAEQFAIVYRALVAKYSNKIKGQFFGHTHSDQLTINTYPGTETPTGFGFICPSMSPLYIGSSRSRIYKLQIGSNNGVSDYTQYILKDLSASVANWTTQYRFRQKYELSNQDVPLTLKQMSEIKLKIFSDKEAQRKYIRNTGLNPEYGQYSYCLILDDFKLRKKCVRKSDSLTDKLYIILDILRGKWGYQKELIKQ